MTKLRLISNATDFPLPAGEGRAAQRLDVRSVTMFATGAGTLKELRGKLM
jgi:hypothetical protein